MDDKQTEFCRELGELFCKHEVTVYLNLLYEDAGVGINGERFTLMDVVCEALRLMPKVRRGES